MKVSGSKLKRIQPEMDGGMYGGMNDVMDRRIISVINGGIDAGMDGGTDWEIKGGMDGGIACGNTGCMYGAMVVQSDGLKNDGIFKKL